MLKIQIVLFDGFDLLDALAPYEVFCAAAMYAGEPMQVELVAAEGPRSVPSGVNGLRLDASRKLDPELGGILLVPGASGDLDTDGPSSIPSILARAANTDLTPLARQALERQDMLVAAVCGGSLLLAMGGLLEGRPAVTHHMGMDVLGATGAVPVKARVVDDGDFVSGGGVTSGLDVALYLVERELGPRIALEVERLFEYERRGTVWRAAGQAPAAQPASEPAVQPATSNKEAPEPASSNAAKKGNPSDDSFKPASAPASSSTAMTGNGSDGSREPVAVPANSGTFISAITSDGSRSPATTAESFDGLWDAVIATPVGRLQVRLAIASRDGEVTGTATQGDETTDLLAPVLRDDTLSWSLRIMKPMRLNLKFEVGVDGDAMYGTVKAGILPASKLTGNRAGDRLP